MPGNLTLEQLRSAIADNTIDTVIAAIVDMQGRLMGKRFHAQNFIDHAWQETHCCNYLLATDLEMATIEGYKSTSWSSGYGDYIMCPDLATLRVIPWAQATALVVCDVLDHHSHEEIAHSPRAMLKQQISRLAALGLAAVSASELEFFVYRESYQQLREKNYSDLTPFSDYNEDYHIFQTAKEETLMRSIRNQLVGAGIPVENTKGEAEAGQAELNVRYSDSLDMADNHTISKHAVKEIALAQGHSVTFLAKCHEDLVGSSSHLHQSLQDTSGAAAFADNSASYGMSTVMAQYLAGQLHYAVDYTVFLAPYINSYKRFASGTFAPTRIVWSVDNRTAGFRIVGEHTDAVRIECRIGGSDMNPYLAMAALIAAGVAGIEEKRPLPAHYAGDGYSADAPRIPSTLRDAIEKLDNSTFMRAAFGDAVIDHYVHAANWEQREFDRIVTDYEIRRGFERA